ncbi:MAG TPA: hypothetical protein VGO62_05035, partial [Myxococcota bacterium]
IVDKDHRGAVWLGFRHSVHAVARIHLPAGLRALALPAASTETFAGETYAVSWQQDANDPSVVVYDRKLVADDIAVDAATVSGWRRFTDHSSLVDATPIALIRASAAVAVAP